MLIISQTLCYKVNGKKFKKKCVNKIQIPNFNVKKVKTIK